MLRRLGRNILPPVALKAGRRVVRSLLSPERAAEEAELERLRRLPEMQPATTGIFGRPFDILDGRSFVHLYDVFFRKQLYRFKASTDSPYIIDCGASTGVSVTWWKTRYPNARVLAFEADPEIFRILETNCGHFKNLQLVNAAVWNMEGELAFSAKGGESGQIAEFSATKSDLVRTVPCVRLRSFLAEKCDFLKMDIEGAEIEVIRDCADVLKNVDRAFIEYHSLVGRPQLLGQTICALEAAGFRLHVHTELPSPTPLHELIVLNDKDLRLDLFCYREATQPRTVSWGQEMPSD
jgi:FkbM family methyltransferase